MIPYPCVLGLFTGVSRYRVSLAAYWSTPNSFFWLFNVLSITPLRRFPLLVHPCLPPPFSFWRVSLLPICVGLAQVRESGRMVFTDVDYNNQAWFYYLRSKNHPSRFLFPPSFPTPRLYLLGVLLWYGEDERDGVRVDSRWGPQGGGRWELLVFCCIWLGLRARCAGIGTGKESGRMVFYFVDNRITPDSYIHSHTLYSIHYKEGIPRKESSTGADPEFSSRSGAKDYGHATHITNMNREVPYGRVLDALSCYLSLS